MGVVIGLAGHEWDIYSSLSVGLGLSIPFSLWWIYFDNIGGSAIRAATEKGRRGIYYIWLSQCLLKLQSCQPFQRSL